MRATVWIVLSAVTVLAYWDVWSFDFVYFDDDQYTYNNLHVIEGLTRENVAWACTTIDVSNWHPLTWLSYMLDVTLFGTGPAGFHVTNLVLHILNTLLVFEFFFQISRCRYRSICVALLFGIHPVNVESVAWISERKELLSTFLGLIALCCYVEYVFRRDRQWYAAALVAFAVMLTAKQMLVTLPCLLLVLDVWPLGRRSGVATNGLGVQCTSVGRLIAEKIPFLLISIAVCVIVVVAQDAAGSIKEAPLLAKLANASVAYVLYLRSLFVPTGLAMFYPRPTFGNPLLVLSVCTFLLTLMTLGAYLLRRRANWLLVGWLWYLGTLVPVIGIVQVGDAQRADRYLYVPAIGIYLIVVWGLAAVFDRYRIPGRMRTTAVVVTVWLLLCAAFLQARTWRDSVSAWSNVARVSPGTACAERMTCVSLLDVGRFDEAEAHCLTAMGLDPNHGGAHHSLARIRVHQKRYAEAHSHFDRAVVLRLKSERARAHCDQAILYLQQERMDAAKQSLRHAIEADPAHIRSLLILGQLVAFDGNLDEARRLLVAAKGHDPTDVEVQRQLQRVERLRQSRLSSGSTELVQHARAN